MSRKRKIQVIRFYSRSDSNYVDIFVASSLTERELKFVVENLIMDNIKKCRFSFLLFDRKINVEDFIEPDFMAKWQGCLSVDAFVNKVKDTPCLIDFKVLDLNLFLTSYVEDFEYYYSKEVDLLRKSITDKVNDLVLAKMYSNKSMLSRGDVDEITSYIEESLNAPVEYVI